ncbi:MAG: ABC transporter ATP-binding protein, partial [Candidatus Binatia bacterium]
MIPLVQKWKDIRQSFTHTPEAVRLVWQTNRWATIGLGFLTLGGALLPASQAWVGKLIVDGVVATLQGGRDPRQIKQIFIYMILELMLF